MKIMELLAKLGILRYGTKAATYTGGKDRPAEFLMDDVYNADRDLVTRQDVKAAGAAVTSPGGRQVFFWVGAVLGALALLIFAAGSGFTAWLVVDLLLWAGFLFLLYKFAFEGRYSFAVVIILLVVLAFVSLLLLGAAAS